MDNIKILDTKTLLTLLNPDRAKIDYIMALSAYPDEFTKRNMDNPLILVHFLAQVMEETGGFIEITEDTDGKDYDNRMGNKPGDGYLYRGRGLLQLTGKNNYQWIGGSLGYDYLGHPELLQEPYHSLVSSLQFWFLMGINTMALDDDVKAVTRRINGGYNGLAVREEYLAKLKDLFQIPQSSS
jgi:putative chitinase